MPMLIELLILCNPLRIELLVIPSADYLLIIC